MRWFNYPVARILIVAAAVAMLAYLPTREFLKITGMFGIPFIFALGYIKKNQKFSLAWILSWFLLLGTVSVYGYLLLDLPDRIAVRAIISEGGALVAEGKYDEAIEKYRHLEQHGEEKKMEEKIAGVQHEKDAQEMLEEALALIDENELEKARDIIMAIPKDTRAAWEADKLLK
ncbi:MAG: hypothetical protein GX550_06085 [Syntrophomonadaceae bacterium]|nr:hypothetical protein [Syntrophomonadaceae bacterium]